MNFICDGKTPHFSFDEVKAICLAAESKSTDGLQAAARKLFPERDPIMYENLILQKGHGRAFLHKGELRLPKWTIVAYPELFGVMEDGTVYPFCDPKFFKKNEI